MIKDRLSFQRFLGLQLSHRVPDANTVWDFREALTKAGAFDKLFNQLVKHLRDSGLIMNRGSIVDASIIQAPIQRNSKEENDQIKKGKRPRDWSGAKRSQKDIDARWTKKNGKSFFGYKNHIKIDHKSKLITKCEITAACVHDSQILESLLDEHDSNHTLYADSAYRSREIEGVLKDKEVTSRIHKKGYRNKTLTEKEKKVNKNKSRIRARVEHIFGMMHKRMSRKIVEQKTMSRNSARIILRNITYNLQRQTYLQTL